MKTPPAPRTDGVPDRVRRVAQAAASATLSEHMRLLVQAGLVTPKRIKQWTFYRRTEAVIAQATRRIAETV